MVKHLLLGEEHLVDVDGRNFIVFLSFLVGTLDFVKLQELVPDRLSSFIENASLILDGFLETIDFGTDISIGEFNLLSLKRVADRLYPFS